MFSIKWYLKTCKRGYVTNIEIQQYCKLLGLTPNCTEDEIKKAFYKKSMIYHPDKNPGDEESSKLFKEINKAHTVLLENVKSSDRKGGNFDVTKQWVNKSSEFRAVKFASPNPGGNKQRATPSNLQTFEKHSSIHEATDNWLDLEYKKLIKDDHKRMQRKRRPDFDYKSFDNDK